MDGQMRLNGLLKIVHSKFADFTVQQSPVLYFEVEGPEVQIDSITKSRCNLEIAAWVINMVEAKGIKQDDQGIVTPYMGQVVGCEYAAANPTHRSNNIARNRQRNRERQEDSTTTVTNLNTPSAFKCKTVFNSSSL